MSAVEVGRPQGHISSGPMDRSVIGSGRTPPTTPKKAGGKMLAVKILMLDDTYTLFQIQNKAIGAVLLEQVCRQLNLLESDYFGLEYTDGNTRYWLDLDKQINQQVCLSQVEPVLRFCVKFYTPDPAQLEEEYTRYLFALQIKRDLGHGELQCSDNTAAVMASYIVQAECGDYVEEDYPDHRYLSLFKFIPTQNDEMEKKIMQNHTKHIGMTPAAADLSLLETARRCEYFGIKMHPAKDHENVLLNLAAAHMGILVFQNYTKINTFSWAKIRKISFKRKRFLIKLHPEGYGYYKDVVEFFFDGRNECKNFWKKCVEHHGFFRCSTVKKLPRHKTRVLSRGSSFRYSGRTQKQVQDYVRDNYIKRQPFQRSQSFRHSPTVNPNASNVGMSISAQPLIPLRDNQCIGTPASLSCGSMTITSAMEGHSPGSPRIDGIDMHGYREMETPSLTPSRQETLSPETSLASSPHHRDYSEESPSGPNQSELSPPSSPSLHLGTPTPFTQSQQRTDVGPIVPPHSPVSLVVSRSPSVPHHSPVVAPHSPKVQSRSPIVSSPKSPDEIKSRRETPPKKDSITEKNQINKKSVYFSENTLFNGHDDDDPMPIKFSIETDNDAKKKRTPSDNAYYILKEILTTERTYKRDLEVIHVWFNDEIKRANIHESVLTTLFDLVRPLFEFHVKFVKILDARLSQWDGRNGGYNSGARENSQKIGDLFLENLGMLDHYEKYFVEHYLMLENIDATYRRNKQFEQIYKDFEQQKVCYLPLTGFLLKPLHRLQHYHLLLDRLLQHYGSANHHDYRECMTAKAKLNIIIQKMLPTLAKSENLVKLMELQRDIVGIDNLVETGREFYREGCLQKLSRKGYQQRMFFLFNDVLLYTNRTTTPLLQFKIHGQLPLRGVMIEENESRMGATNCFTIYGANRAIMVAANSEEDKARWLEDLSHTIAAAKRRPDNTLRYPSLKSISASDEVLDKSDSNLEDSRNDKLIPQTRSNTTVHVCWHRATSVSFKDYNLAVQHQLSGYLLRKFKNSMGWQKLWVIFTNFCLFFYKTFQDDYPLASLPLLGYTISTPGDGDQIQKEFVFKLQFKNHIYFFRAESEYTFSRWMEVIATSTKGSARQRIFSRKDSQLDS